jgi:hypothetical protein
MDERPNADSDATWQEQLQNQLNRESQYGTIKVTFLNKTLKHVRLSNSFMIEFRLPNGESINFGTRKAHAYILKQLLENFGEHTLLRKFTNPTEYYAESIDQTIIPLKKLLQGTGCKVTHESADSLKYSVNYKDES